MKLHRLDLASYGAFTDRAVEFGPGLTVVYGPNESGKTTISHALGDLLWGLEGRSHPYAFLFPIGRLRLTATVTCPADPANKVMLTVNSRGCRDSAGTQVSPWWRTGSIATRDAWRTALGLDLPGLRSGANSVLGGGGDLAGLLFRARTGIDVVQALETLTAQADAAYKRRANAKTQIRLQLAELNRAREATVKVMSSAADVEILRVKVAGLDRQNKVSRADYSAQQLAYDAAEESRRAWEPARNLETARARLRGLQALGRLLEANDLEAYDEANRQLGRLVGQLAEADQELSSLVDRLVGLVVDEPALGLAADIDELQAGRAVTKHRSTQLAKHRLELVGVRQKLRLIAVDLAPDGLGDDPASVTGSATGLLIAADVADRIHRAARELRELYVKIATEEHEVTALDEQLTTVDATTGDRADRSHLDILRTARNQAWEQVKAPWLSGKLPDGPIRLQLAGDLSSSMQDADENADLRTASATETGRLLTLEKDMDRRRRTLGQLQVRRNELSRDWTDLLSEAGIPVVVDPEGWQVRWDLLTQLVDLLHEQEQLLSTIGTAEGEAVDYAEAVVTLGAQLGIPVGETEGVLQAAVTRLGQSRTDQAAAATVQELHTKATRKIERLTASQVGQEAVISRLQGADDLAEMVERSRAALTECAHELTYLQQVDAAAQASTDREELVTRLAGLVSADLDDQQEQARIDLDAALEARDGSRDVLGAAQKELETAERIGDAANLRSKEIEAAEGLAADVAEYVQLRVMMLALERLLAAEEPDRDSALLTHASTLVNRLTNGRVTQLVAEDRAGERRLRIEAEGLSDGVATELSEGTADQVFLALRLAGIRQMQERAVADGGCALLVVLDDVLVTHDDGRTAIALEVLAEEAHDQQIVLMTHHRRVAEAAESTGAKVVTLPPLPPVLATGRVTLTATASEGADPSEVRAWALEQGLPVGERGRIKGWIVEAYGARDLPDVAG